MKKFAHAGLILAALASVAACSPKAQNESAEAADAITADANATMGEAVSDTEAASDAALGAGENAVDDAGARIDNASDAISNEIEE